MRHSDLFKPYNSMLPTQAGVKRKLHPNCRPEHRKLDGALRRPSPRSAD
jgi:hypothetical protein